MIPFSAYQLYQVERALTDAERRRADARAGEVAATLAQFRASVVRRASALFNGVPRAPIALGVRPSTGGGTRRLHQDKVGGQSQLRLKGRTLRHPVALIGTVEVRPLLEH